MKFDRKDLVYWIPRVLTIIFLGFLALFSLDIFEGNYGFWGTAVGLFMHNIPVMILAIVFVMAGLWYITLVGRNMIMHPGQPGTIFSSLIIAGPALFIGILFLVGWYKKRS